MTPYLHLLFVGDGENLSSNTNTDLMYHLIRHCTDLDAKSPPC